MPGRTSSDVGLPPRPGVTHSCLRVSGCPDSFRGRGRAGSGEASGYGASLALPGLWLLIRSWRLIRDTLPACSRAELGHVPGRADQARQRLLQLPCRAPPLTWLWDPAGTA